MSNCICSPVTASGLFQTPLGGGAYIQQQYHSCVALFTFHLHQKLKQKSFTQPRVEPYGRRRIISQDLILMDVEAYEVGHPPVPKTIRLCLRCAIQQDVFNPWHAGLIYAARSYRPPPSCIVSGQFSDATKNLSPNSRSSSYLLQRPNQTREQFGYTIISSNTLVYTTTCVVLR